MAFQSVIDGGARIFVAGLGVPREVIDLLHAKNILVGSMCGKVRHAQRSGQRRRFVPSPRARPLAHHNGTVATISLVPQVVGALAAVPCVADGRLRRRAACRFIGPRGGGGVIGHGFIATPEARAVNGYKEPLLATAEDGTVISRSYTGKTCRVVRNEWTNHFDAHPEELQPFPPRPWPRREAGANHLGFPDGTEVGASREFMPCGRESARSASWSLRPTW